MKTVLLAMPLLAVGVMTVGCTASPTSSAASPTASATASSVSSGAASSSPAAAGSSSGPAAAPTCTSADLQASLGGGTGTGMSQNHTGLQLRNTGLSACTLYGYPGVSWVAGADGHQVGAAAERQPEVTGGAAKIVILAPHALASAPLDIVAAAAIPSQECKPVPVRGLRVYPPGEKAALFLPLPTASGGYGECSLAAKQPTLIVGYLEPGVQPGGGGSS